jgi:predicted membrane-bound spermidine synthase
LPEHGEATPAWRAAGTTGARGLAPAFVLFVLSGAAALVYQVAWQRLLALSTGVGVHSVAIITAAFMAGLGIGSQLGGSLSARLTARRSLVAFGLIELGVGAFAALSVPFYYGLLYQKAAWLYDGQLRAAAVHFLSLLPPTALMGTSLPFLVRGLVRRREGAERTIGLLYAANALGAAGGALLTPWLLMRFMGLTRAVLAGAAGSAIAGLGALLLARRGLEREEQPAAAVAPAASALEPPQPFGAWIALYALSGMVCLSLEIVWFRVLDVAAKGAAFTFGTLLCVYLVGLGCGSLAAAGWATRVRRPVRVFLLCQCGIVLTTLVAHLLLIWLPPSWPGLAWLVEYGRRPTGVKMVPFEAGAFVAVYAALPLLLFGPSTFLMGVGFPVLQRATQTDAQSSGRRVGVLQAANIAGCVVGSLATGLFLLERVGTSGVFRALTLVSAALALFGWWALRERRFVALAAALLVGAAVFPSNHRLWLRLHGSPPAEAKVEESAAGVTVLTPHGRGYRLVINGRYNSWLPYGWLHTVIGSLPAIAHPRPQEVAVVGLGSGDTTWAAACREETQRAVVFEIATSQPRLLARVAHESAMVRLRSFLSDPRVSIVTDDGRRRLSADRKSYDVIVVDSIDYDTSLSTHVHSLDFFRLARSRLKPGGLFCALAKTPRIRAAVSQAFAHTVFFREDLVMGSADPIPVQKELWRQRLWSPRMLDYLGKARVRQVLEFVEAAEYRLARDSRADVNRDVDPKDEFFRPLR